MAFVRKILGFDTSIAGLLDPLQSLFALAARWYVSWQFLQAGYLKVTSWDTTLNLFENEYHTPVMPPHVAAVAGSFGELFFPALLILGFVSRIGAIGLSAVNAMAVISYSAVLLAAGSEAALAQHILWATLLLFLALYGPGKFSLDYLLKKDHR
jgi:putative oxidoreductase